MNDNLQAVVDTLEAVEVEPGYYAWVLNGGATRKTYVVAKTADLLTIRLDGIWPEWPTIEATNEPDNRGTLMPSWWSPEKRYAIAAQGNPPREGFATVESAEAFRDLNCTSLDRIVTADLETGAEVPA